MLGVPGGSQTVDTMFAQIRTQTGVLMNVHRLDIPSGSSTAFSTDWQGECWNQGSVAGLTSMRFVGVFSASSNANLFSVAYGGIIIPRGNAGAF